MNIFHPLPFFSNQSALLKGTLCWEAEASMFELSTRDLSSAPPMIRPMIHKMKVSVRFSTDPIDLGYIWRIESQEPVGFRQQICWVQRR